MKTISKCQTSQARPLRTFQSQRSWILPAAISFSLGNTLQPKGLCRWVDILFESAHLPFLNFCLEMIRLASVSLNAQIASYGVFGASLQLTSFHVAYATIRFRVGVAATVSCSRKQLQNCHTRIRMVAIGLNYKF